jgi:hypothetical protein
MFMPASSVSWGDMIQPSQSSGSSSSLLKGGNKKNKRNQSTTGQGPNSQGVKKRTLGKKAQKKQNNNRGAAYEPVVTQAVQEAEYEDLVSLFRGWIEADRIEEEVRDEFPNLQAIRVETAAIFEKVLHPASEYSLYALAKRAMGPDATILYNNQTIGKLWLAWVTIAYDLWANAITSQKSLFTTAHPHYRRTFNFLTFKKYENYLFTWSMGTDFFTLFNALILKSGPTTASNLAWEIAGLDDPVTGRRLLTNTFPVVNLDLIRNAGATVVGEIFNICLNKDMRVCSMEKVPKYQLDLSPAAFVRTESDNNPDFPLSITIESEVPIPKSDLDISELQLAASSNTRTCPHKVGSIAGTLSHHLKLVRPELFKQWVRPLPKEIPISSIMNAYLTMLALGDRAAHEDLDPQNIIQPVNSIFTQLSSGQLTTAALLEGAQKFIIGNTMMGLNGCVSGSIPLCGDVRGYVPISTYNNVTPTALRECLTEFSIHEAAVNAITKVAPFGKEIYVPFISARGLRFAVNPLAVSDTNQFDDFMQALFPFAPVVNNNQFANFPNPAIPNFIDVNEFTNMYFVGATPTAAISQVNGMSSLIQASLQFSSYTDVRVDNPTLMYFTQIIADLPVGQWDETQRYPIYQVSNRFPLSSQIISTLPNLTPVFYAGQSKTAAGFLAWYSEYSTLLAEDVDVFTMITRWFRMFAHLRASRGGWGPDEYYLFRASQNKGGGFFGGIKGMLSSVVKGIANFSGAINSIAKPISDSFQQRQVHDMIEEVCGHPEKYGNDPYLMMKMQTTGFLSRHLDLGN